MLTENKLNASSIAYKELLRLNKVFIGFFEIFFRPIVFPFKGSITCKYPSKSPKTKLPLKLAGFESSLFK